MWPAVRFLLARHGLRSPRIIKRPSRGVEQRQRRRLGRGASATTDQTQSDCQPAAGTLSFVAGETVKTISVAVISDGTHETKAGNSAAPSNPEQQ